MRSSYKAHGPPGSPAFTGVLLPLEAFAGQPSNTRIIDLPRRLRCDSCGELGKVLASVGWAELFGAEGLSVR